MKFVLFFIIIAGCFSATYHDQPIFVGIYPKINTTISVDPSAPIWLVDDYKIAIQAWNDAVGESVFQYTDDFDHAYVKIYNKLNSYNEDSQVVGYTYMVGCMLFVDLVSDCSITMYLPDCLMNDNLDCKDIISRYSSQNKIDQFLISKKNLPTREYIRDKYATLIAIHELGHAIGLNHNNDMLCAMYPNLHPFEFPCPQETKAVKYLLGLEKEN